MKLLDLPLTLALADCMRVCSMSSGGTSPCFPATKSCITWLIAAAPSGVTIQT